MLPSGWTFGRAENYKLAYFDVLLTVHCSNDQFLFQLMHHNITLLTKSLYMFRAPTCPSSGGQTIHTPQLVQLHKPTSHTVVIRDEVEPVAVYV